MALQGSRVYLCSCKREMLETLFDCVFFLLIFNPADSLITFDKLGKQ